MRDRFDVQLGVARPVETGAGVMSEAGPEPETAAVKPAVVVEYRNRGIPVYLMPPLLIVLAALGIMSYQNMTTPYPLRRSPALAATETRPVATEPDAPAASPVVAKQPVPAVPPAPALTETTSSVPPRPPVPAAFKSAVVLVETSAEKPVPPAAPRPITDAASLFDHDTTAGLRPVVDNDLKRTANTPEPPLVAPASKL
ncbi:MAG: hypothetical protein P4L84_28195 [Isosphaeraceae bacterium]|nr:hypothetical protein [Isosphaeraceae bacterium]